MKLELFVLQPILTAAMQIICMTTDTYGYHMDMKLKRKFLYHFSPLKVIPQKTKFNIECLKCSQYDKLFTQSGDLKRHKMTYSGEKGYNYSQCDKSFVLSGSLKTHHISHTGRRDTSVCSVKSPSPGLVA